MNNLILCVDDDEDDLEFLSEALKSENSSLEIVSASNGFEAIKYLTRIKETHEVLPCIILMDINMPVLDGKQTFKQIKNDPFFNNVPVIFFTSSVSPNDKLVIEQMGGEMFTKPAQPKQLSMLAQYFLSRCK